jgi:HAMP domain-containing protein
MYAGSQKQLSGGLLMKRFNDQSIRTRLTIAFSIMSAMAIVLGLVGMLMEQSQTKTITMIVLVVFAATASTALGRVISISVYVPIRKLTEAAGRLAAGDTNVTISISTKDEIGKLAAAFHKLHSALMACWPTPQYFPKQQSTETTPSVLMKQATKAVIACSSKR